jgi:hypothetical protein
LGYSVRRIFSTLLKQAKLIIVVDSSSS